MADRLTLKGVKVVTNHTGTNLQLVRPKKGSTHPFKQWWDRKGSAVYNETTIFSVNRAAGDLRMVIPTGMDTRLTIAYDGADTFVFSHYRAVDRVALVADDDEVLIEYIFPRISGGKIMKRTVKPLPTAGNIGNVAITGTAAGVVDTEYVYSATNDGNATGAVTYTYTAHPQTSSVSGASITFQEAGDYIVTATGHSSGATDDGFAEGDFNVSIQAS